MSTALAWLSVPVVPTFEGVVKKLADGLEKPATQAGKRASEAVQKSAEDMVKSLASQMEASSRKLKDLDAAYETSIQKRQAQQQKLNAAIADQVAAEEKYQAALKKGNSGATELAKLERAKAKVVAESIKMEAAERDILKAEQKHASQLKDLTETTKKYEQAQQELSEGANKSKAAFGGIGDALGGIKDQIADMGGPVSGVADLLSSFKLGPAAGVAAVASAAVAAGGTFLKFNEELAQSQVDMQNRFGLSADAARGMQREIADALGSGMGDYQQTAETVLALQQSIADKTEHLAGETVSSLSDNFLAFTQTFGTSMSETVSLVDNLLNTGMVKSAEEGIDLLTAGFQKVPEALQGEVLDALNEYSKHFANMGLSGSEAMAMLVQASGQGQIAIDKVGDAVKEFSLKAVDPAVVKSLGEMGVQVEDLSGRVARGGSEARDAMSELATQIMEIPDEGERAAAAIAAFGTPLEDLSVDQIPAFLEGLASSSAGMGDFSGASQAMADNTTKTFTGMFDVLKGKVHGWAIDATVAINEWAGGVASAVVNSNFVQTMVDGFTRAWDFIISGLGWAKDAILASWEAISSPFQEAYDRIVAPIAQAFTEAKNELSAFGSGIVEWLGLDNLQGVFDTFETIKTAWGELFTALSGGDDGYGALAQLIGVEDAQWIMDQITMVQNALGGIWDWITEKTQAAQPFFEQFVGFVTQQVGGTIQALRDALGSIWEALQSIGSALMGAFGEIFMSAVSSAVTVFSSLWSAIKSIWEALQPVVELLSKGLWPILQVIGAVVGGVLVGAFLAFVGALRVVAEVVSVVASGISWLADNVLGPLISILGTVVAFIVEHVVKAFTWFGETVVTTAAGIIEWIAKVGVYFTENFWPVVESVLSWVSDKWHALYAGFSTVWGWIRDAVLAAFTGYLTAVLWPAVQAVLNWIGDRWSQLGTGMAWVKDSIILPVFNALGSGLDTLKGWFQTAVDAIAAIWDRIRSATAKPIRFVVETVINNGIFAGWNKVAGLVGLDEVQPINLGVLGSYRSGGLVDVLPGYTPGKDPYTLIEPNYGFAIGLSGGEGIIRPEGTAELGTAWVDGINAAAKRGGRPAVRRWLGGFAGGGVIESITSIVREKFPMMTITSTFRPGDPGWHGQGKAVDFSNGFDTTPQMQAAAKYFAENYGSELLELIHSPFGGNVKNGQSVGDGFGFYGAGTMNGHRNHVHIAAAAPLAGGKGGVLGILEGVVQSAGSMVKGMWDKIISAIPGYGGAGGSFANIPEAFLKKASEMVWGFLQDKVGSSTAGAFMGDPGAGVEQWRGLVVSILKAKGFDPILADTVLRRMNQESGGNARAINNWDINAVNGVPSKGLMQVIDPTFQAHKDPGYDDIWDPESNIRASMNYAVSRYGSLPAAYNRPGGYADGGIVELAKLLNATAFDVGGVWKHGTIGVNLSGEDEFVLKNSGMRSLGELVRNIGALVPAIESQTEILADYADKTQELMTKVSDPETYEGMTARALATEFGGILGSLGLEGTSTVIGSLINAENELLEARSGQEERLAAITEKEKAHQEALKELQKLQSETTEMSVEDSRKLKDALKNVEKAKEPNKKGEVDSEKLASAEEKLARVREDLAAKGVKDEEKRAEDIKKATEKASKAEQELLQARRESAKALDMPLHSLVPQIHDLANAGASAAGQHGLGGLADALSGVAALAGPSGLSVGVAVQAIKSAISVVKTIVNVVKGLIERIQKAIMAAHKAYVDGWETIAKYAMLVVDIQTSTAELQQALVRGINEQRAAEFKLKVAVQDRIIAQAEGELAVAQARLKLDEEIRKSALAAQLRLMGLHEDWDSYLAYQAKQAQGVMHQWSDAAISALYSYEAARAKALQGELKARVEHIKAEAALAEAARVNVRNQQDLLAAQERLIRMSAKVAGVDLVEATGTASVANLLTQMAEVKKAMDANLLGRAGAALGLNGPFSNEYRGQKAQYESLRAALDVVMRETGVTIDEAKLDKTLEMMAKVAFFKGDPMAVLRSQLPELVAAETALKINEALDPVYDARDKRNALERKVEDFRAEIALHDKVTPLEDVIKGLDYTVQSLEQSAQAWAEGNEKIRGDYLKAAEANRGAAAAVGVNWQLDPKYANGQVTRHIAKQTVVYLNGHEMYTADQVDKLLREVTSGTNADVIVKKSASLVADSRRREEL